jgi:staphylococcal nuclease domain-containing protein 1
VETVDRTGTFLGSLWESRTNGAVALLEAGLAILQTSFGSDRIPDLHVLEQAEQSAKSKKLKVRMGSQPCLTLSLSFPVNCSKKIVLQIWENFAEGEVVPSGANVEAKQKEILKVRWNV